MSSRRGRKPPKRLRIGKPDGNYVAAVEAFIAANPPKPGTLTQVNILHDDYCGVFEGKICNCNPRVEQIDSGLHPEWN